MTPRRFTKTRPCPICGGHDRLSHGQGIRCFGYYDETGAYARCTREEKAGGLPQNTDGTYSHRLGRCRCGEVHGEALPPSRRAGPAQRTATPKRQQQRFRSYFTLRAFLLRYYGEGASVTPWIYRDREGREALRILRIDYTAPDGTTCKSYRPCHRGPDQRWRLSKPDGLLPLYNLQHVIAAPPLALITILEGEKCADIATAIGVDYPTTSAHGALSPQMTDWSPLAGRSVAIVRDEGERGGAYAAKVAAILAMLDPPASARIIWLPGLSNGDDIEQWIAAQRAAGGRDSEILNALHALIETATC